jgi:hypothetical protein
LAIRDKLNSCIRRKSRLPSSFGRQIELHDFRERFLNLSLGEPYQKFFKIMSSEELKEIGNKKELIV